MKRRTFTATLMLALTTSFTGMAEKEAVPDYTVPNITLSMNGRLSAIKKARYLGENRHDFRCADGYTGQEVFEMHQELRSLVQQNFKKKSSYGRGNSVTQEDFVWRLQSSVLI